MPYALCLALACASAHAAPNLSYTISVEQDSATAVAAKTAALGNARRAAFENVLSKYAEREAIENLSSELKDADILNLVGTMSIADEKSSATAYSATVTITLDRAAVQKFLDDNNVPNYMGMYDEITSRVPVFFDVAGLRNWAALVRDLREAGVWGDLDIKISSIWGRQVSATIRAGRKKEFIKSVHAAGWRVWEENGMLRASKS